MEQVRRHLAQQERGCPACAQADGRAGCCARLASSLHQRLRSSAPVATSLLQLKQQLHAIDLSQLSFVGDSLRAIRSEVAGQSAVLGFVGSPWTLATYVIEGASSSLYKTIKTMTYTDPKLLDALLSHLADQIGEYVKFQIDSGADCIMLFDSWGGQLPPAVSAECRCAATAGCARRCAACGCAAGPGCSLQGAGGCGRAQQCRAAAMHPHPQMWDKWSRPYIERIVQNVRAKHPTTPLTLYANGSGGLLERLASTGVDVVGLDWTVDMADARRRLGPDVAVQGNIDPVVLFGTEAAIEEAVASCLRKAGDRGHVLNLGHGVLVGTPEEAVAHMFDLSKRLPAAGG
jgi:uroporphyrinogen decarboxylase